MRAVRILLVFAVVLVTVGCVLNVFSDDAPVRSQAEAVACPHGCTKATSVRVERTAIAETVEYDTPGGLIHVRCTRAAVIVGPYTCVKD